MTKPRTMDAPAGWTSVATLLGVFVSVMTAGCVGTDDHHHLSVLFADRGGLESGDAVIYEEFEVGEVRSLRPAPGNLVAARVAIDSEYGDLLREGIQFTIQEHREELEDDEGNLLERVRGSRGTGEYYLAMSVPDPTAASLPDSATISGYSGPMERILDDIEDVSIEAGRVLVEKAQQGLEEAEQRVGPDSTDGGI